MRKYLAIGFGIGLGISCFVAYIGNEVRKLKHGNIMYQTELKKADTSIKELRLKIESFNKTAEVAWEKQENYSNDLEKMVAILRAKPERNIVQQEYIELKPDSTYDYGEARKLFEGFLDFMLTEKEGRARKLKEFDLSVREFTQEYGR